VPRPRLDNIMGFIARLIEEGEEAERCMTTN